MPGQNVDAVHRVDGARGVDVVGVVDWGCRVNRVSEVDRIAWEGGPVGQIGWTGQGRRGGPRGQGGHVRDRMDRPSGWGGRGGRDVADTIPAGAAVGFYFGALFSLGRCVSCLFVLLLYKLLRRKPG